ncbi:mitochondrial chaperone BCS1-like [Oppia nitens]|uniref:mitochondrial chaperone BCS1-like n=1 Tax=Oppia nitens TaxID=1686743 RepID=UPI0023DC97EF|nr:mitochondrial chaperone BCS1-like [Oppia nitens]
MGLTELLASLQTNPYFGAGFGLVGVTAGLAILRKGFMLSGHGFQRYALTTCEVNSKDKSFQWLLAWISRQSRNAQHVAVNTDFIEDEVGRVSSQFGFVPAPGIHFFRYNHRIFKCERRREQMDALAGVPYEVVTLTTLGRDKSVFYEIFGEARDIALKDCADKTATYIAYGHEWRPFGRSRPKRPIDSVILADGVAEIVTNDLYNFITSSKWYHERGIPYRRGYLFHGPPGTGKSSFIFSLAGLLHYSICVLNVSDQSLTDDRLIQLLNTAPKDAIVLLEDIDAAAVSHSSQTNSKRYEGLTRVTYSGLLNALDGVVGSDGRIVMMTTNHIHLLDSAMTRPGRVDLKVLIDNATDNQIRRAFCRFYPNNSDLTEKFLAHVRSDSNPVSMARIQAHFLLFRDRAEETLAHPVL